ncbi:hypothetical protein HBB16_18540 [Pseudonocardia sp. MCCB 268]|nr:hypothetical protein [Pseudonocardia cytotoxica]
MDLIAAGEDQTRAPVRQPAGRRRAVARVGCSSTRRQRRRELAAMTAPAAYVAGRHMFGPRTRGEWTWTGRLVGPPSRSTMALPRGLLPAAGVGRDGRRDDVPLRHRRRRGRGRAGRARGGRWGRRDRRRTHHDQRCLRAGSSTSYGCTSRRSLWGGAADLRRGG